MCTHTHTHMVTKNIAITQDAYDMLKRQKRQGESFSEVINRSFTKKGDISQFIGAWSDMSDETAEKIKKHIETMRSRAGKRRRKELMRHFR